MAIVSRQYIAASPYFYFYRLYLYKLVDLSVIFKYANKKTDNLRSDLLVRREIYW